MFGIFKSNQPDNRQINSIENDMDVFFMEKAIEAGYTEREKQYDMAQEVLDALMYCRNLIVEAGVGIGKTFAYLVPLLLRYEKDHTPFIIATSTIALQEQLEKDIRDLARILGIQVDPVISKGQTHFICSMKLKSYHGPHKTQIKKAIEEGAEERRDLPFELSDADWNNLCVEKFSFQCQSECKHECGYCKMRDRLKTAGITICNQNQLTNVLRNEALGFKTMFNPNAKMIVIDEAHNLEEKVRESTQQTISKGKILHLFDELGKVRYADHKADEAKEWINRG